MAHVEKNYPKNYIWLYAFLMGHDLETVGKIRSPLKRTCRERYAEGDPYHVRVTVRRKLLRDARELAGSGFWKFHIGSLAEIRPYKDTLLAAMPAEAFAAAFQCYHTTFTPAITAPQ
jgi:hypothetical protein